MSELDTIIHQPTRLRIMMILSGVESADFAFLINTLGLTKGNLSSHMSQLEAAGYIEVIKTFKGKTPHTSYSLTGEGRTKLEEYWGIIDRIRDSGGHQI